MHETLRELKNEKIHAAGQVLIIFQLSYFMINASVIGMQIPPALFPRCLG